jgi:hypothetical protein
MEGSRLLRIHLKFVSDVSMCSNCTLRLVSRKKIVFPSTIQLGLRIPFEAMAWLAWLGPENPKLEARARSSQHDGLAWLDEAMA